MSKHDKLELDTLLNSLARDERKAAPSPSDDLIARVLADAGTESAALNARPLIGEGASKTSPSPARIGWFAQVFGDGWITGAAFTMLACLVIGMSFGAEGGFGLLDQSPAANEEGFLLAGAELFAGDSPF